MYVTGFFYCVAGQAVDVKKMAFSFDDEGAEQWKNNDSTVGQQRCGSNKK